MAIQLQTLHLQMNPASPAQLPDEKVTLSPGFLSLRKEFVPGSRVQVSSTGQGNTMKRKATPFSQ